MVVLKRIGTKRHHIHIDVCQYGVRITHFVDKKVVGWTRWVPAREIDMYIDSDGDLAISILGESVSYVKPVWMD